MPPRVVLIAGPTASGKSALAQRVARRYGGVVINADSMQVYRDLRILTARPTPEEELEAPHRLFGHVDGAENYSVGRWLEDFGATLRELAAREQVAVVAGGTGLYFKAALRGLSDIPAVPTEVRAGVRERARGRSSEDLHSELARLDPLTAGRLRPSDPQRILRALEIFEATGQSLTRFQGARRAALLDAARCSAFFIEPSRSELFARIDARFDHMIASGALEEARALGERRLDPLLPVMRAHGAPHLLAFLAGNLPLEEAVARGKSDTRHYAKRQMTFARHQLPEFIWLGSEGATTRVFERLDGDFPKIRPSDQ
ncbi:MAG: tRNA (adenosine(37)-N6)-dimethylallyltransferase MiaA [Methylocystis sp.]